MSKLLEKLATWIKPRTYGSDLEAYIVSKHPQNAADVERLSQEFVWARGL